MFGLSPVRAPSIPPRVSSLQERNGMAKAIPFHPRHMFLFG
jgi:hypothetical protein